VNQEPRQNRAGHPCPPWCVTDHDAQLFPGHFTTSHGGPATPLQVTERAYVSVRPCYVPSRAPEVQVTHSGVASIFLKPATAEGLAGLLDALADAAPADVRALAAAIRQAAAITDAKGASS
jgi:Domain of unknown function (DUF6907)